MFRNIFKRRNADHKGECRGHSLGATQAPGRNVSSADDARQFHIAVDEAMTAISHELHGLAQMEVDRAARERGWAILQRELERRPVRLASPASRKSSEIRGAAHAGASAGSGSRSMRWQGRWLVVAGMAVVAVAVIATLAGIYGGGQIQTVDGDDHPTTLTSMAGVDTTVLGTTVSTGATTPTTGNSITTEPVTVTTVQAVQNPDTTGSTGETAATDTPSTTDGVIRTTTTQSPTTTQPTNNTTPEQQAAAAQREKVAKAAALDLGSMVVEYFATGDMSGARALVASGAQSSLVQMISSLNDPNGFHWISSKELSSDTVRITLEFSDRVLGTQGELVEVGRLFALTVGVDEKGAVITAISAGS